jgi:hypothetical protein
MEIINLMHLESEMETILEVRLSWNLGGCYADDRAFLCKDLDGAKEYLHFLKETDDGIHDVDFKHFVEAITTAKKSNHSVIVNVGNDSYEAEVIPKTVW